MNEKHLMILSVFLTIFFGLALVIPANCASVIVQDEERDMYGAVMFSASQPTLRSFPQYYSIEENLSCNVSDDNLMPLIYPQEILAQRNPEPSMEELQNSISNAVLTKLTIWRRPSDQTVVYAQHCRRLRHGCETQVRVFVNYIVEIALANNIDPWLFAGMAWHESRFNPGAESDRGAVGLFQLLRGGPAARGMSFVYRRWFRQECSRQVGVCQRAIVERAAEWFLASIEQCNGSIANGLRAYNSGVCDGPRRYYQSVFEARDELMEIANSN